LAGKKTRSIAEEALLNILSNRALGGLRIRRHKGLGCRFELLNQFHMSVGFPLYKRALSTAKFWARKVFGNPEPIEQQQISSEGSVQDPYSLREGTFR
jgi:hypothetical protein